MAGIGHLLKSLTVTNTGNLQDSPQTTSERLVVSVVDRDRRRVRMETGHLLKSLTVTNTGNLQDEPRATSERPVVSVFVRFHRQQGEASRRSGGRQ
jgi:hypothetical protein